MENNEANWKKVRNRTLIKVFLLFIALSLTQVMVLGIVTLVGSIVGKNQVITMDRVLKYSVIVTVLCALINGTWCGILYKKSSWRDDKTDYRKVFSVENLIKIIFLGLGGYIFCSLFMLLIQLICPGIFDDYNKNIDAVLKASPYIMLIYTVFVGPVCEELIFRGAIFDRLYLISSFWLANVLQAVLFAVYHMNLVQGVYAFIFGMILGMVRMNMGSIFASILTHCIFNSGSYIVSELLGDNKLSPVNQTVMIVFYIVFFVGFLFFVGRLIMESIHREEDTN